jgi:hypothetical protein
VNVLGFHPRVSLSARTSRPPHDRHPAAAVTKCEAIPMVMLSESIQSLNMPVNFDNMPCRREGVGRAERTHVYSHATGGVHCGRAIIRYGACCGLVVVCIVILGWRVSIRKQ